MKRIIKNIFLTAAAILLAVLLCIPAKAADIDYTGPLDPQTGEPVSDPEKEEQGETGRVRLSGSMYYDWNTHDFVFPVSNTVNEVHASVADGMIISGTATISPGAQASASVYLNGSEYTGALSTIKDIGDYVVFSRVGGDQVRLFSFKIVGSTTNAFSYFSAPEGFYITEATRDGEPVYFDRYSVRTDQEGLYHIEYECKGTDIVYTLETSIDRTPPELEFTGRINDEWQVRSELHFSGLEQGDSIALYRGGVMTEPELKTDGTGTIYDTGTYLMQVFDAAGNSTEYRFSILMYFNISSLIFIALICAIIIGTAVYILVSRKKLRIG